MAPWTHLPSSFHICGFTDLTNKCFLGYSECFTRAGTKSVLLITGVPPSVACCLARSRLSGRDGTSSQVLIGDYQVGEYFGPSNFSMT